MKTIYRFESESNQNTNRLNTDDFDWKFVKFNASFADDL